MKSHNIFADPNFVEPKALEQFFDALKCDFSIEGALMPDAHVGYSLPIGTVIRTKNIVVPAWVGYDIGCGVSAFPTIFRKQDIVANAQSILEEIYRLVPVGTATHNFSLVANYSQLENTSSLCQNVFKSRNGFNQMGTLGGGNHFIEVGYDEGNCIWITVHSGSRGFGHGLATEYMKLAAESDKPLEGHFGFNVYSTLGSQYLKDMEFALWYAEENRFKLTNLVRRAINNFIPRSSDDLFQIGPVINKTHNHAVLNPDGTVIHRKGATQSELGVRGVIPGNMRDGSFIVEGLGNPKSLCSSSHGAGRVMGRGEAKRKLQYKDLKTDMLGITARLSESMVDESPNAYKDIFQVMDMQSDLCKVIKHIKPIINIKG